MKLKPIAALAALMLALAACGCATSADAHPVSSSGSAQVASVLSGASSSAQADQGDAEGRSEAAGAGDVPAAAEGATYEYDDGDIEVDLSQMSGMTVYSAVYQMLSDPDSYRGKVIRMQGIYYSQPDDKTGVRYYFCIVKDATACCSQGIEFVWDDGQHAYPDEYPEEGAEVLVTGVFNTYEENSVQFAHLEHSSLTAL